MTAVNGPSNLEQRIVAAGDSATVLELENRIDPTVNARAVAVARAFREANIRGVRDVVTAYRSVTVYFDPLQIDAGAIGARLRSLAATVVADTEGRTVPIRVPVCYGGAHGPDLSEVAAFAKCSEEDVIQLHTARTYRVYMLGFMPGYAYMASVDDRIAIPRLTTPRLRVPAGSVAIAGSQTGIYPIESPGGWRLIGRTPVKPFDAARAEAFLFKPGDSVAFHAIRPEEFAEWVGR